MYYMDYKKDKLINHYVYVSSYILSQQHVMSFLNKRFITIQMQDKPFPPPKQSFCRFYLRGLCVYSAKECPFAHGVWDLNFAPYNGEQIIYDYHKSKDHRQPNTLKTPPNYLVLYDYQQEKIFTLHQLNTEKPARYMIRTLMHQQLYDDFMQLLQATYPGTTFTQSFIHREFNRVGFNKILMADLKFNQIANYLCDNHPHSRYYRATKQKQAIIVKKAPMPQILSAYMKIMEQIIGDGQIDEAFLKKKVYTTQMPQGIPPINAMLKELKVTLKEFIEDSLGIKGAKMVVECSVDTVVEAAAKFIAQETPKRLIEWSDVFRHVTKTLKNNNGNVINQARPYLTLRGNAFLSFPMHQLILNPKVHLQLEPSPCKCSLQKPYPASQLLTAPLQDAEPLVEGQSYDIYSFQTLSKCAPHILSSSVLGVDLQGRLRRGGFVEMVQLNNGRNTFLIDIWHMNELGDFQAFWLTRKVLRNVMVDENIVKIFHDCRHDSIGLHQMLETCIVNVFDTSATETLLGQLEAYQRLWREVEKCEQQEKEGKQGKQVKQGKQIKQGKQVKQGKIEKEGKQGKQREKLLGAAKQLISQCANVRTPGLNQIFQRYEASHGINKNKDKYHKMWSKGDFSFFCKRPIDPDYREYCIRDVLDLPEVYEKMLARLQGGAETLAYWISNQYAKQGYEALEENQKEK